MIVLACINKEILYEPHLIVMQCNADNAKVEAIVAFCKRDHDQSIGCIAARVQPSRKESLPCKSGIAEPKLLY